MSEFWAESLKRFRSAVSDLSWPCCGKMPAIWSSSACMYGAEAFPFMLQCVSLCQFFLFSSVCFITALKSLLLSAFFSLSRLRGTLNSFSQTFVTFALHTGLIFNILIMQGWIFWNSVLVMKKCDWNLKAVGQLGLNEQRVYSSSRCLNILLVQTLQIKLNTLLYDLNMLWLNFTIINTWLRLRLWSDRGHA